MCFALVITFCGEKNGFDVVFFPKSRIVNNNKSDHHVFFLVFARTLELFGLWGDWESNVTCFFCFRKI